MATIGWLLDHWRDSQFYLKDKTFPAVYCFYDVTGKLVYFGETKNLAQRMSQHFSSHYGGHLKDDQYKWVNKIMYVQCKTDADALIIETCLIGLYPEVEYNGRKFTGAPTIIDADAVLNGLVWEEYINFNRPVMVDMWVMPQDECVKYIEQKYDEYVRQNNDNESFLDIFRLFGREFYKSEIREKYCYIVQHIDIPDFDYNLVKPIMQVLLRTIRFKGCSKSSDFRCYGDIGNAFVANYNMPKDVISIFKDKNYVKFLSEYVWGKYE